MELLVLQRFVLTCNLEKLLKVQRNCIFNNFSYYFKT